MAKLYYRYGAMGSSKSAQALMVKFNYEEQGKKVLFLKPNIDTRDGADIVKSRIGIFSKCHPLSEINNLLLEANNKYDCIILDEAQFATSAQVDRLAQIVDNFNIPVICYGLKTDFTGHLFDGSKRLTELADEIEEIKTVCWCGRAARFNARVIDGELIKYGKQIVLGANEMYVPLCRKHFFEEKLKK